MKAYKVVYVNDNGAYESATILGRVLIYCIDKETRPFEEDGPIAAFDTINNARNFAKDENRKIFECEATESERKGLWCFFASFPDVYKTYRVPVGTIFCDSIKLLKEVE